MNLSNSQRPVSAKLKRTEAQRGFTLIEMSIVLVIIGLIVGGILKGQEVVNNGRVKIQVAQIDSVKAAVYTFQDQYQYFPGDLTASVAGLTAGATTWDGNQDGVVANHGASTPIVENAVVGDEMGFAWKQLSLGGLLSGAGGTNGGATTFAGKLPGSFIAFGDFSGLPGASGKFIRIQGVPAGTPGPIVREVDANAIDAKYDDGVPNTGSILAGSASSAVNCCNGVACTTAAGAAANTVAYGVSGTANNTVLACVLFWQL